MKKKIELYRNESQLMSDAIDCIVVEYYRRKREKNSKTFLLTGCSSEVGTTSISIDVAIALSIAGWKTILVDCDLRKKPGYKRLNSGDNYGLVDYLNGTEEKSNIVYDTNYDKLSYIPCGSDSLNPVRLLCSNLMEDLVKELKSDYDFVIFDFPSIDVVPDADILGPYVDAISLVAALEVSTKRQLMDAKLKMLEYGDKYIGLIINQVDLIEYRKINHDYDYFIKKKMDSKLERGIKKNRRLNRKIQGGQKNA